MSKIRTIQIEKQKAPTPSGIYTISVDGKETGTRFTQELKDDCKLAKLKENDKMLTEIVDTIMCEINNEVNLSADEVKEYSVLLHYILED